MVLERTLSLVGSFRDRVVLITGASSGIGRETALTFARLGACVALAARRRTQLEAVAAEIDAGGGRVLVIPTDVTERRAARAAVAKVRRKWGAIDLLVNNAGVLIPGAVEKLTAADFEAMLRVNVFGALFMMQAVLGPMQAQGHGTIVNVASLAGRRGIAPLGGYCATKFALVGLTEALRTEIDTAKIHVGLVLPGVVETPMVQGANYNPLVSSWPAALNMPAEWVVAAILLSARFRLAEISVPPGVATMELFAALAPSFSDTLIRWTRTAAGFVASSTSGQRSRKRSRR